MSLVRVLINLLKIDFMKKILIFCAIVALFTIAVTSCNVTRTVTTQSQYFQKGDTTCTIVTKTIESYDATKKTF